MKMTFLPGAAQSSMAIVLIVIVLASPSWPQENSNRQASALKEKSPGTAFLLSVLGTAFPYALSLASNKSPSGVLSFAVGSAFLAGPSFGFFYAGLVGRGLLGVGVRASAAVLMAIGTVNLMEGILGKETSAESVTFPFYVGAGIVLGSIIWDLSTVMSAVRKRNEKVRNRTLALSPFFDPRTRSAGLSLQFSF